MFRTIILISLVIVSFAFTFKEHVSTAQYPDLIIFEGTKYSLHTNPLEPYFEKNPDKRPQSPSTALYRGYIAHFEIIDSTLVLTDISQPRRVKGKNGKTSFKNISIKKQIFQNVDTLKVDWYSGILILPYGERIKYVHSGYASEYSNYILLEIKNGIFNKVKKYKHQQFLEFKKRQFSEFKKTKEYKTLFEQLKNNYPESNKKFIEDFLKDYITNYTSKFLID